MSTTLILHESTMATSPLIFSSRESMYTTMRPPADGTSLVLCLCISSPSPWTTSNPVPLVRSSGRITSFLGSLAM
ncbi:hypothetical protein LINPERPRIM_LOCUS32599 [Linum perenne]